MDVVAAIQNSIDIAGKLRALSKKVEDADFKMLVADLSNELAEAKLEVARLKEELAASKTNLREQLDVYARQSEALEQQVRDLQKSLSPNSASALEGLQEQILVALTRSDELTEDDAAAAIGCSKHIAAFHLEELRKRQFVSASHFAGSEWSGGAPRTEWSIEHRGREYLVRRGLLT